MRFIFRTDVHMSDKAPVMWKADYQEELFDSLRQIGQLAQGAVAVLDGGDFFHVKAATRTSHSTIVRVAELHREYPCPVYAIEGNHDLSYNNIETIDKQPLGVLFATGVFRQLRDETFPGGVRVVGMPYLTKRTLEDLRAIKKKPGDKVLIAVVHALASATGSAQGLYNEPVFAYQDLVSEDGPDIWLFGHWHKDQGIQVLGDTWFVNPGAMSRGALNDDNLTRRPHAVIIDIEDDIDIELHDLRVLDASDAFNLEKREAIQEESMEISDFVARLQEFSLQTDSQDISDFVKQMDFARDVQERALEYLQKAREE